MCAENLINIVFPKKLVFLPQNGGVSGDLSMTTARHTFATVANLNGMPFKMVEQAMGHHTGDVSDYYFSGYNISVMRPHFEKLL